MAKQKIKYPETGFKTIEEKHGFACAAREKLRLEHNVKGAAYKAKTITKEEWESYLTNVFEPTMLKVSEDEPALLEQLRAKYMPSVDTKTI